MDTMNRMLQQLRTDGLIELSSRTLTIKDVSGLGRAAGFDDSFLHIERPIH